MTATVSIILAGLAVFAVIFPFLRPAKSDGRRGRRAAEAASGVSGFGKELEADYRTGIISKDEYEELRQERSAPEPDQLEAGTSRGEPEAIESDIERRVRELRQRKGGVAPAPAGPARSAQRTDRTQTGGPRKAGVCPKCGRPYKQGDRFCTTCGTRLTGGGR
jgi:hypothetical protein